MSIVNVNGTVALFFANFIGKIFGAVYRIPLSNFLGAEGMGLYQMAFPIYSFLLTIVTGGISITLTRKIASARARGDVFQIQKDYKCAKRISIFLGFVFLTGLLLFSYPIALIQGNSNAVYGYIGISIGFVFACLLGAYRGYYQGFGNMIPTAISQIIEQIAKLILGLVFAAINVKYGIIYGVFGAVLGVSLSEIICLLYFKIINRKLPKQKISLRAENYKNFFKQMAPVSISCGILPLSSLIDSFLVINLLSTTGLLTNYSTSLYGLETGMILPLINMPNVLITAIAVTAIPELTYKMERGEEIYGSIVKIFKLAYIFILPCAVGLFLLSNPILSFIYRSLDANLLSIATNLLKISVFEMFFLCFVTISNAIVQAMGKIKLPIYSLGAGLIVKILLSIFLITNHTLNIYGLVIASTMGYFITCMINLRFIKKESGFSLKKIEIIVPMIACVVMAAVVLLFLNYFNNFSIISVFAIITIAVIIYFSILLLFKQLNIKELKNLLLNNAK